MAVLDELLASWQGQQDRANAANELRYKQGMEILDEIIGEYETGGSFEKATEAALQRGETQAVTRGVQSLVSSGLSNTTQAAGLSKKFEEEVGAPTRLKAADVSAQRLAEAKRAKVGFIERREDTGPSFGDIASLISQISQGSAAQSYSQQYAAPASSGRTSFGWGETFASEPSGKSARRASQPTSSGSRTSSQPAKERLKITYADPIMGQTSFTGAAGRDEKKSSYQPFNWTAEMIQKARG